MKHTLLFFVVFAFLLHTAPVHAQTLSNTERDAVLQQIRKLTLQVQKLQKQLAALTKTYVAAPETEYLYKTKFHTGKFESLYAVEDGELVSRSKTKVRAEDQLLWNTFIDIAGNNFIDTYISEFRVYNDLTTEISAFIEEKPNHTWILGFNREGEEIAEIYNDSSTVELFLHEYGHIVFFNNEDIEDDFAKKFWKGAKRSYDDHPERFVTEYAATSPVEDLVESFVQFVLTEKPTADGEKFNKIRFFYQYPTLVSLRLELRKSDLF